jgi:hypothetical protein
MGTCPSPHQADRPCPGHPSGRESPPGQRATSKEAGAVNTASIGQQDRSAISDLLEEVARLTEPHSEVGAAASYWAQAVWSGLRAEELQTVAWLLRDGDRCGRLPTADGERARRWATLLEDAAGEAAVLQGRRATRRRPPRRRRARRR